MRAWNIALRCQIFLTFEGYEFQLYSSVEEMKGEHEIIVICLFRLPITSYNV